MDLLVACYRWCLRNGRLRTFSGIFRAPRLASEVTLFGFFWANQRADQKLVKFRAPSQGYAGRGTECKKSCAFNKIRCSSIRSRVTKSVTLIAALVLLISRPWQETLHTEGWVCRWPLLLVNQFFAPELQVPRYSNHHRLFSCQDISAKHPCP